MTSSSQCVTSLSTKKLAQVLFQVFSFSMRLGLLLESAHLCQRSWTQPTLQDKFLSLGLLVGSAYLC